MCTLGCLLYVKTSPFLFSFFFFGGGGGNKAKPEFFIFTQHKVLVDNVGHYILKRCMEVLLTNVSI